MEGEKGVIEGARDRGRERGGEGFGELKDADSVKACDLSVRQHFPRVNVVVIADQA